MQIYLAPQGEARLYADGMCYVQYFLNLPAEHLLQPDSHLYIRQLLAILNPLICADGMCYESQEAEQRPVPVDTAEYKFQIDSREDIIHTGSRFCFKIPRISKHNMFWTLDTIFFSLQ